MVAIALVKNGIKAKIDKIISSTSLNTANTIEIMIDCIMLYLRKNLICFFVAKAIIAQIRPTMPIVK